MIKLGEYQTLEVLETSPNGIYLSDPADTEKTAVPSWQPEKSGKVLLPRNQVPEDINIGDTITVFLYKDSEDRLIATTAEPLLTLGGLATLKVLETNKIGAFLDWGLSKDLFLPFKEQTSKVAAGEEVLVTLYIDKSERLCATMNVYHALRTDSPYEQNNKVTGTVYEPRGNFGVFVAVDNMYSALIPKKEVFRDFKAGEKIEARITRVHEDGKLELSVREKTYKQMDSDSTIIYEKLTQAGGFLPFHDKSDPEDIKNEFSLSKNAFKRAIGHLMKEGKIKIEKEGIRLS